LTSRELGREHHIREEQTYDGPLESFDAFVRLGLKADVANVTNVIPVGRAGAGVRSILRFAELNDGTRVLLKTYMPNYLLPGGELPKIMPDPKSEIFEELRIADANVAYRSSQRGYSAPFRGVVKIEGFWYFAMEAMAGDLLIENGVRKGSLTRKSLEDLDLIFERLVRNSDVDENIMDHFNDLQFFVTDKGRVLLIDSAVLVEARDAPVDPNASRESVSARVERQTFFRMQVLCGVEVHEGITYLNALREKNQFEWWYLLDKIQSESFSPDKILEGKEGNDRIRLPGELADLYEGYLNLVDLTPPLID
jgi:hypothetical protein